MLVIKELNIPNIPKFIFDSMINFKKLNTNLVGLEKILVFPDGAVSYDIYPTHIVFNNVDIYFECVKEGKYLVFALIDKNLDILENYKKIWDKIKMDIKLLEGIVGNLYFEKDIMKVKFDTDDDLVFNKIINVPMCAIVVKAVYEHDNKFYPRIYLHSCYFNCFNDEDGYVCINARI